MRSGHCFDKVWAGQRDELQGDGWLCWPIGNFKLIMRKHGLLHN